MFLLAVSQTYSPLAFTAFSHNLKKSGVLHPELSPGKIVCFVLTALWRSGSFAGAQKYPNTIDVPTVNRADHDNA